VQSLLPALRQDAARRTGLAAERLRVAQVQDVTWSDGSLGCPRPGQSYTMALVPGWRIVLEGPGAAVQHYHASQRGSWVWCPAERSGAPPAAEQRM
jgi:hypothetical protein